MVVLNEEEYENVYDHLRKCGNEWWVSNNSGPCNLSTCQTRPDGEPEVWDGKVWFGPLNGNLA